MIYRETADGTRYVYILAAPAYPRREPQVFQQELGSDGMFVGPATPAPDNRRGICNAIREACSYMPSSITDVETMLTASNLVMTIRDDIITMRRRRSA